MRNLILFAPVVLLWASAALADDDEIKCNLEGSQAEMNACAYQDFQKADAALNAMYKKAVAYAKEQDDNYKGQPELQGAMAALKKAQRAWIDYRDGHCDLAGFSARGGSMEPMLVSGCQMDITQKRTAELKALLEEGDQ